MHFSLEVPVLGHVLLFTDRVLALPQEGVRGQCRRVWMAFHGYGERADHMIRRMKPELQSGDLIVSVQAPHSFYRDWGKVGYCWQTEAELEHSLIENRRYIARVLQAIQRDWEWQDLWWVGFSQGAQTAWRAAVAWPELGSGLLAIGLDIPKELHAQKEFVGPVLQVHPQEDPYYSVELFAKDQQTLSQMAVDFQLWEPQGGHDWPQGVLEQIEIRWSRQL
jgi:predicted esterase